jgi:hypothetical protein
MKRNEGFGRWLAATLAIGLAAGCGSSGDDSNGTADNTAPGVVFSTPVDLAADVALDAPINARFSEPMNPATIDGASFTVGSAGGLVAGTVSYTGTTATFMPTSDLDTDTLYTATISLVATDVAGNPLQVAHVWTFTTRGPIVPPNPPIVQTVVLGEAAHYAVLAGFAVTNIPTSDIVGDVGLSPSAETFITGFAQTDEIGYATSPQVTGSIYAANMASPTPALLTVAKGDLTIAFLDAAGRTPIPTGTFLDPGAGNLAGLDLPAGLYKFTGSAIATTDFTLTGTASAIWIFQIASNLNVSNGVRLTLAGGARAENVFWQVGTEATLGTTVEFAGTIMADASITMNTGATLNGRALAFSGTVALDQNMIVKPGP